jgi:hypothetical protein
MENEGDPKIRPFWLSASTGKGGDNFHNVRTKEYLDDK